MTWLVYMRNPFDPTERTVHRSTAKTIREALRSLWPDFIEFTTPTITYVNGKVRLRSDWDEELTPDDCVLAVAIPLGTEAFLVVSIVLSLVSIAASVMLAAQVKSIGAASVTTTQDPAAVFTFAGQSNLQKLNQPIEVVYGRNRWWPSYVCAPRVEYIANETYLHVWLSLGFGEFDIEQVNIGDSDIDQIAGCNWVDFGPESSANERALPWLQENGFYDKVYAVKEVSGIELKAPNEDGYAAIGPYAAAPAGATIDKIQMNIVFPQGCYGPAVSNKYVNRTVALQVQIDTIDSVGNILTSFSQTLNFTFASSVSQRQSIYFDLGASAPGARAQITVKRVTPKPTDNGQDQILIESIVGLGDASAHYAPSTMYLRILGTNRIASDAASTINVVATRRLPVYAEDGTYEVQTTRHPIWAFIDILTNTSYGSRQSVASFDLAYFVRLAMTTDNTFDYIFNQKTTAWEAAKAALAVIKGAPFIVGSDYRVAIPQSTDQPVALFTPDNAYNLTWTSVFPQSLTNDSVVVTYTDPTTGLQASVQFVPYGSDGTNPKTVEGIGLSDRDQAWHYAAYVYGQEIIQRDTVEFSTGLEGFIPLFGDVIAVSWSFPAWGAAGVIESFDTGVFTLSDPLDFTGVSYKWIALRRHDGRVAGPYRITGTGLTNEVTTLEDVDSSLVFLARDCEPVMYTAGDSSDLTKWFRVKSITPQSGTIKITAEAFDPSVFAYEAMDVPLVGSDQLPYPAPGYLVPWVRVYEDTSNFIKVQWGPAYGSAGYKVWFVYDPFSTEPNKTNVRLDPMTWLPTGIAMTEADVIGSQAYVPRQVGELYVVVNAYGAIVPTSPDFANGSYWRARLSDFAQATGPNTANNFAFDTAAWPVDTSKFSAQAATGYVGTAIFKSGRQNMKFSLDAVEPSNYTLQLTWTAGGIAYTAYWELKRRGLDELNLTPAILSAAGLPVGDPINQVTAISARLIGPVEMSPLIINITPVPITFAGVTITVRTTSVKKFGTINMEGYPYHWAQSKHKDLCTGIKASYYINAVSVQPKIEYAQLWEHSVISYWPGLIGSYKDRTFNRSNVVTLWNCLNGSVAKLARDPGDSSILWLYMYESLHDGMGWDVAHSDGSPSGQHPIEVINSYNAWGRFCDSDGNDLFPVSSGFVVTPTTSAATHYPAGWPSVPSSDGTAYYVRRVVPATEDDSSPTYIPITDSELAMLQSHLVKTQYATTKLWLILPEWVLPANRPVISLAANVVDIFGHEKESDYLNVLSV